MSPRGKLPIEPLPGAAWKRVREEVFAELQAEGAEPAAAPPARVERWPTRWPTLLASAAALTAIVMAVLFLAPRSEPVGDTATSRIATVGEHTRATVGDATLDVGADTEVVTTGSDASGWTVLVERGHVAFAVPKREGRPRFRVVAGRAKVEVVGTRFTVSRSGEAVRVRVEHGRVRVTADGESRELADGEHWEAGSRREAPRREAPVEVATPKPQAASSEVPLAPPALPLSASPEPVREEPARLEAPRPPASTGLRTPPTRQERYEAASRLEAKQPAEAVAAYLELARGSDAWAANALYAAARLELERGRPASARSLLEQYQRRFPGGPNAEEARTLLHRIH
jgi:hypothetical protein